MALKSNKTCLAIAAQSAVGTFVDPGSAIMPISNLTITPNVVTAENNEYTGSVHRNAPEYVGESWNVTFDVNLRGPGGAAVPSAGAFLPGLLFTGAKFTENRVSTAIPAAPEALTAGSTTGFTGGAGLAATAGLYKGLLVQIANKGTGRRGLSAIRSYSASKVIALCDTLASAASGNYQIPKQLAYQRSIDETDPLPRSIKVWVDGVRYDLVDAMVTSMSLQVPTSTKDQAGDPPLIRVTMRAELTNYADEATPAVPSLGPTPRFKDGQQFLALTQVGGAGFNVDFGVQTEAAPNPNKASGSDADEIVGSTSSATVDLQAYRKATFDDIARARAGSYHPYFACWGTADGQIISVNIPDARFNLAGPNLGQGTVTKSQELWIDVFDRNVSICFAWLT